MIKKQPAKPGDVVEWAMWLDGTETDAVLTDYTEDAQKYIREEATNWFTTPAHCYILQPGEDRTPEVPDHISGPDVRLMVIEAEVMARKLV